MIDQPMTTVEALTRRYKGLSGQIENLQSLRSQIGQEATAAMLAERPTFPTDAMREGIGEAARRIYAEIKPPSHHGESVGDTAVSVDGSTGWIRVNDCAPYRLDHRGGRIWEFSESEVAEIIAEVQRHGLTVTDHWLSMNGLSMTTRKTDPFAELDAIRDRLVATAHRKLDQIPAQWGTVRFLFPDGLAGSFGLALQQSSDGLAALLYGLTMVKP